MAMKKHVRGAMVCLLALTAAACGSSTIDGYGTVVVTGLAPGQTILCVQQGQGGLVQVVGRGFLSEHGVDITVRYDAEEGTPLQGGTSDTETVMGEVISDTLIECTAPNMVGDAVVTITVVLPGGNAGTSGPQEISVGGNLAGPFAYSDSYDGIGNVPLTIAAATGVLDNDDPRGCYQGEGTLGKPAPGGRSAALTGMIVAFDAMSANGGTVTMTPDGGFTYSPPTGFNGLDTFGYTMEDQGFQSSATAFINVTDMVWFINDQAPPMGDGHFDRPLGSLFEFNAIQGAGSMLPDVNHYIYVYRGSGLPYDGGIGLLDGQHLIGQGVELVVQATSILPAGMRPLLTDTGIAIGETAGFAVVVLANRNEVKGVDIEGPASFGILGQGVTGPTVIEETSVQDVSSDGIHLNFVAGSFSVGNPMATTLDSVLIRNVGGTGIFIGGAGSQTSTKPSTALTGNAAPASLVVENSTIDTTVEGSGIYAFDADVSTNFVEIDDTYNGIDFQCYSPGVLCTLSVINTNVGVITPVHGTGIYIEPYDGSIDASITYTDTWAEGSALQAGTLFGSGTLALALDGDNFGVVSGGGLLSPCVQVVAPAMGGQTYITQLATTLFVDLHTSGVSGGFLASNAIFDADPDTAGIQTVVGQTLRIGASGARVQGTALDLSNCSGAFSLDLLEVVQQGGNAAGFSNTGTLTFTPTTVTVDHVP